jgi:hypothetical protein
MADISVTDSLEKMKTVSYLFTSALGGDEIINGITQAT